MTVPCPLCEQFSGKPESVRAHISAKQDARHQGHSGFDYETELGLDQDGAESDPEPDHEQDATPVPTQNQGGTVQTSDDAVEIQSVERDETDDGTPVVKLVLAGAAIEGLSRALTGKGLVGQIQDGTDNRDRI